MEDTAPGIVLLNLAGLEPLLGPLPTIARDLAQRVSQMGLEANVAVAVNPDAALLAARGFPGITLIPEGREAQQLGDLPVDVLLESFSSDAGEATRWVETFDRWGIRKLRALAGGAGIVRRLPVDDRRGFARTLTLFFELFRLPGTGEKLLERIVGRLDPGFHLFFDPAGEDKVLAAMPAVRYFGVWWVAGHYGAKSYTVQRDSQNGVSRRGRQVRCSRTGAPQSGEPSKPPRSATRAIADKLVALTPTGASDTGEGGATVVSIDH